MEEIENILNLAIIKIVIIIAFKGAVQNFFQSLHCAANCLQHVRSSGPGKCKSWLNVADSEIVHFEVSIVQIKVESV